MTDVIAQTAGGANFESGKSFLSGSSGRWAGERMMEAIKRRKPLSPKVLRTNDTLQKDEWKHFDEQLIEEAQIRLKGVADLLAAGLVRPVARSMGKTVFEYERITDMEPATLSLDGNARGDNDRQEFELGNLPLPICHKDFFINLRTLEASRERGESLDTTQVRTAGRLCAELLEKILFQGHAKVFGGMNIYGYTTHPNRNTVGFGTNGNWVQLAKTGADMLADVLDLIEAAEADRMYGPYWLYIPRNYNVVIDNDFKANSDKTIRQRLLEVDGISQISTVDQLPANNIVLVQPTSDVVVWVQGEGLQTIQWDVNGGFMINFKAFTIGVPLIRADAAGRCGIVHMS